MILYYYVDARQMHDGCCVPNDLKQQAAQKVVQGRAHSQAGSAEGRGSAQASLARGLARTQRHRRGERLRFRARVSLPRPSQRLQRFLRPCAVMTELVPCARPTA